MRYSIVKGTCFLILFSMLLLLACGCNPETPLPKVVTIEVDINANGTIVCNPGQAEVESEDTVKWHINTNNWGAKNFTLALPGPRYPVQPGGEHTIDNPKHCDFVTYNTTYGVQSDFYVVWPPAMTEYTYRVDAHNGSANISANFRLIR